MAQYDKYRKSNYVQKSDVDPPILVTIAHVAEEDVSMTDQPAEMKYVIHFEQDVKPWVPGIQMLEMIHQIAGDGDVDHWDSAYRLDKGLPVLKIVLWCDPTVAFRGKVVGGIRCHPPKNQVQAEPVEPPARKTEPPLTDDDLPF